MLARGEFPVLLISTPERRREADRTIQRIVDELVVLGHRVEQSETVTDSLALVGSDPSFGCIVVDWGLGRHNEIAGAEAVITAVRARSAKVPIFIFLERGDLDALPLSVIQATQEYVFLFEDTPGFIAGRIEWSWRRYTDSLLPPFFQALIDFTDTYEYSMHTPGHAGGTAFRKSAVGKAFYDFYGESLFRTDLSVSVEELGSLLDHSGKIGESERQAARIFSADFTYYVLNGTSTANQIVGHSCITAGDVVLVDRNCHKSMNYSLTVTDAVPVYLMPVRNGYGIIGPIPEAQLSAEAVARSVAASPLVGGRAHGAPVYAAVTNSTYDGICYQARRTATLLGASVPRVHFDEAWFAYACFHPLYRDRYAMHPRPERGGPTLYATQSTHKLLAAFSQASMIHIRSSQAAPVDPQRFNEAYMMHGSTSPFYPMIACLDVAAAMMDAPGGRALVDESILEAVRFRKQLMSVGSELTKQQGWFFGLWQPESVRDPHSSTSYSFVEAPDELLTTEPSCWELAPGETWHGFSDLTDGFCMLDPIKVTITTPGIDALGTFAGRGIPAQIVTRFLDGDYWLWGGRVKYAFRRTPLERTSLQLPDGSVLTLDLPDPSARERAATEVKERAKLMCQRDFSTFVDTVVRALGMEIPRFPDGEFQAMSWEEARQASAGSMDRGAHGQSPDSLVPRLFRGRGLRVAHRIRVACFRRPSIHRRLDAPGGGQRGPLLLCRPDFLPGQRTSLCGGAARW